MHEAKDLGLDLPLRPPASMEVGLQFAADDVMTAGDLEIAVHRLLQAVY